MFLSQGLSKDNLQRSSCSDKIRCHQSRSSSTEGNLQRLSHSDKRICYQVGESKNPQHSDTIRYSSKCGFASSTVDNNISQNSLGDVKQSLLDTMLWSKFLSGVRILISVNSR